MRRKKKWQDEQIRAIYGFGYSYKIMEQAFGIPKPTIHYAVAPNRVHGQEIIVSCPPQLVRVSLARQKTLGDFIKVPRKKNKPRTKYNLCVCGTVKCFQSKQCAKCNKESKTKIDYNLARKLYVHGYTKKEISEYMGSTIDNTILKKGLLPQKYIAKKDRKPIHEIDIK